MKKKLKWLTGVIIVPIGIGIFSIIATLFTNSTNIDNDNYTLREVETVTFGDNSPVYKDIAVNTFNYQNTKDPNYLNERNNEILGLNAIEIVEKYFNTQNSNKFSIACSLLPKIKCDSANGIKISEFSKESMKYINGYEDIKIWEPKMAENKSEIICAKYSYILKSDTNPSRVTEILSVYLDKREDNEWQITSRVC